MKKLFFVAMVGIAGVMSANTIIPVEKDTKKSEQKDKKVERTNDEKTNDEEWCGTVYYHTSCGVFGDSYCSSWGPQCAMEAMQTLEDYYCNP